MVYVDPFMVGWVIHTVQLSLGAIFFVIPCWIRLWQWRAEHHIITKACLLLLIPDLIMTLDFIPIHIRDLALGELIDDSYCKFSSFLIVTCILASNIGNITVAYVTRRMLDPKDQKVTNKTLYVSAAVGWSLGLLLASYFAGMGYLGSHRGVYCCTNRVRRGDIAGPVFFVYAVCIGAMVWLYRTAYVQVASVVMPSAVARPVDNDQSSGNQEKLIAASPRGAVNGGGGVKKAAAVVSARKPTPAIASVISGQHSSESIEAEETIAKIAAAQEGQQQPDAGSSPAAASRVMPSSALTVATASSPTAAAAARSPASASARSPNTRASNQQSAAASIARRGIMMVVTYYACWSLISLNAVFELVGYQDRSLWWDVLAASAGKLQPSIDAIILLASMNKVHEKRQAAKQRNETSTTAPRVQVKVDGDGGLRSGAASPSAAGQGALSQSKRTKGRLVSNGAVSPRYTAPSMDSAVSSSPIAALRVVAPVAAVAESPPPVESPLPVESPPPPEDQPVAAANTITHRRTASSDIVQYR